MKNFWMLFVLMLLSCSFKPKFEVGDCAIMDTPTEKWEDPHAVEKIIKVGDRKYLLEVYSKQLKGFFTYDFPIKMYDDIMKKANCPNNRIQVIE